MKNNNNLIEFFQTIKKDKEHRRKNNTDGVCFEICEFLVVAKVVMPKRLTGGSKSKECITLDAEDIEYLAKKYRPKLEEELKEKQQELENKYKDL